MSRIALARVGYTIRWILSFFKTAPTDSAQAPTQRTPVLPTEALIWSELNKMAFWGGCCGIPGWCLWGSRIGLPRADRRDGRGARRPHQVEEKKRSDTLQTCEN